MGLILLNFAHPLLQEQIETIETIVGVRVKDVREIESHIDTSKSLVPQVISLVDSIQMNTDEWEIQQILINPPSLNYIAVTLLAELHGRMGYFPPCLRIKPVQEHGLTRYKVAEIIDLQTIRDTARGKRQ